MFVQFTLYVWLYMYSIYNKKMGGCILGPIFNYYIAFLTFSAIWPEFNFLSFIRWKFASLNRSWRLIYYWHTVRYTKELNFVIASKIIITWSVVGFLLNILYNPELLRASTQFHFIDMDLQNVRNEKIAEVCRAMVSDLMYILCICIPKLLYYLQV